MKPTVIFGGTFDPVHIGHLRVALEASEFLDAHVRLMPANKPPHRAPPVANPKQRAAMLELAVAGQKNLSVDTRELRRGGSSYTLDTLIELRREFPPEQSIALLLGADAFAGLPTWHRWRELFALAHFVVLARPGHDSTLSADLATEIAARRTDAAADVKHGAAGKVIRLAVTQLEISASDIRHRLARGRDVHWLVPDALLAKPSTLAPYRSGSK
ncbi:MAG TPA: nicotinate-nucleotide adenylyltransferase [Rudaea sp.]|jgi:nicotinate-nucleotide adenylyltransferase|nr:nicotinate-nucleotide adenylyltransferase [Rudaea sp.]